MPKLRSGRRRGRRFPEDFVFGAGTSDHQCEAYDPAREDIRDIWERATGRTLRGRATDFWNRYPEDIDLAAGLGCGVFRFSVSWTRVEPEPGRYDEAALEHYQALARRIESAGMRAILTLHHFTWPPHLEAEGGMLAESFPDHFAAYAEVVARRLAPHVSWWITFNEPTFLPLGYLKLWGQDRYLMPPGLGDASAAEQIHAASALIRNLFLAHARARHRIRAIAPKAQVGVNPFVLGMPEFVQKFLDKLASRTRDPVAWARRERRRVEGMDGDAGGLDVVMGALSWTPERERQVLLSEPYESALPVLLVPASSAIHDRRDLGGAKVAVVRGSTSASLLRSLPRAPRLRLVHMLRDGLELLRRGRVDGLATDDLLLDSLVRPEDLAWRRVPLATSRKWYCAAVAPHREGLLQEVDAAIREVVAPSDDPSGLAIAAHPRRLVALARRPPLPQDAAPPPSKHPAARRARAIARIRKRGLITVGVRCDEASLSRCDPATGQWSGLEVDIARALANRVLGDPSRVRFVELSAHERVRSLHSVRSRVVDFFSRWRGLFSALTNTNWWYLGMAGRLPEFLCPRECVGQLDFVGFDYYWGVPEVRWDRVMRLLDSLGQRYSRAPVYPGGLLRLLRRYRRMFPGKPLLVIENGSVDHTDGVSRASYLRAHLREVQRACAAGIPVKAYVCWSITTNREWGLPLGADSDFGLYHIDLDTDPELRRIRTAAADTYAEIIAGRDANAGKRQRPDMLWQMLHRARVRARALRRASRRAVRRKL
jgi:beta-glucosidase/6-phospho-beta-glucosidase/beta-galactosidase/ABC-type amino acid transport substrate-binding protein